MSTVKNRMKKVFFVAIGIIGVTAGIYLIIRGKNIGLGIAGVIASIGITVKGFWDLQRAEKKKLKE